MKETKEDERETISEVEEEGSKDLTMLQWSVTIVTNSDTFNTNVSHGINKKTMPI